MSGMQAQLESLAEQQEYTGRTESGSVDRKGLVGLYGEARAAEIGIYYRQVRELPLSFSNKELEYSELRSVLKELATEGATVFLDITAVKKHYLGDIVAASLVEGIHGLWTFDLLGQGVDFKKPWTMLIHELRDSKSVKFRYTNILDTDTYKACKRLVFIRAPKYRNMAICAIILMIIGAIGYLGLGEDNVFVKLTMALSGIASIVSLIFIFIPPRSEA
jgi:hypothetical protein